MLAILHTTLPEGVPVFRYECLNLENKELTLCSFNDKIYKTTLDQPTEVHHGTADFYFRIRVASDENCLEQFSVDTSRNIG